MRVSASNHLWNVCEEYLGAFCLPRVMGSHCKEVYVLSSSDKCQQVNSETLWRNEGSLVAHLVKNPPAMQETWVWHSGWEDPLEKAWQPTPVFLPGESHGQRTLVGYSPRGCRDSTERLTLSLSWRNKIFKKGSRGILERNHSGHI